MRPRKILKSPDRNQAVPTSPNLVSPLYGSVECEWQISTSNPDEIIKLELAFSSLDNSSNCEHNYIAVYDGPNQNSELMGKTCGNKTTVFVSTSWSLYVVLQLTKSNASNALLATYFSERKEAECSEVESRISTEDKKYISSPEFPRLYKRKKECSWLISASRGKVVRLEVVYADFPSRPDCMTKAKMSVYDGNSRRDTLLDVVCSDESKTFVSTGQEMLVTLKGDNNVTGRFLAAYYSEVKADECVGKIKLKAQRHTKNYLHTPSFPAKFKAPPHKFSHCLWVISADGPDNVKLTITYSNLVDKSDCATESINVYDGDELSNKLLGVTCGDSKPTYMSTGRKLMVVFTSTNANGSHGFLASYYSVPDLNTPRQQQLVAMSSTSGYIYPPNFPQPYQSSISRSWAIRAKKSEETVVLEVAFSDIFLSPGCETDFVVVYDGATEYDQRLGKWCGIEQPKYVSSGRDMLVIFHTNSTTEHTGFLAAYHTHTEGSNSAYPNHVWLCVTLLIVIVLVGCFFLVRHFFTKHGHPQWSGNRDRATESMGSGMDIYDHASTSVSMRSLLETS